MPNLEGLTLFYNEQAFSPTVASGAVAAARPGGFPFGDRIAAETGGAVDPHRVPSAVVDWLPGRGVCHDGKVALRRGSGIEVARHELAHAHGADEATAQRAAHDPRVLRGLPQRPPVDGWDIGFEFESGETKVEAMVTKLALGDGFSATMDVPNLEMVTVHVPESDAGRAQLARRMDGVVRFVSAVAGHPEGITVSEAVRRSQVNMQVPENAKNGVITAQPGRYITAHPQATAGIKLEYLYRALEAMTGEAQAFARQKATAAQGKAAKAMGWDNRGKYRPHKKPAAGGVRNAVDYITAVVQASDHRSEGDYARLKGLVAQIYHIIGVAAAIELDVKSIPKYLMPLMQRTQLGVLYQLLSDREKEAFAANDFELLLRHCPRYPDQLGRPTVQPTLQTPLYRYPANADAADSEEEDWGGNVTLGDWFQSIVNGRDALKGIDKGASQWDDAAARDMGMLSASDIGPDPDTGEQRNQAGGIFEFRRLKADIPHTEWAAFALGMFDTIRMINRGGLEPPDPRRAVLATEIQAEAQRRSQARVPAPVHNPRMGPLFLDLQAEIRRRAQLRVMRRWQAEQAAQLGRANPYAAFKLVNQPNYWA